MDPSKFVAKAGQTITRTVAQTEPAKVDLEAIADETHAKYGAELFAPRTRAELRDEADTMYRGGLLAKYLPKDGKAWTKEQRYAYATNRALIAFLAGAELGLLPLQAVRGIYFVEDQPSPAAKTLVGLIKKRASICEYWMVEKSTDTECTIVTKRRGSPKEERLTVTLDQFPKTWREEKTQYGSPKRPPWALYPSRQLHARCSSWLAGMVYQDITLGFYAAEEMSSAAWERKYADVGRAVVQVPGSIETDSVLDEMVEEANDGGHVEAPITAPPAAATEAGQEAPAAATAGLTKEDLVALMTRVKDAGNSITQEQVEAMRAEVRAFEGVAKVGYPLLVEAWNASKVKALGPFEAAS